jgi:hypothetical protein
MPGRRIRWPPARAEHCARSRGIGVPFAAENLVAIDCKFVIEILFFGGCFLDEAREGSFDRIEFSSPDFEVGLQADEV